MIIGMLRRLCSQLGLMHSTHYTEDYFEPNSRSIGNGITITLKDGTVLEEVSMKYPVGHKSRREEGSELAVLPFDTSIHQALGFDLTLLVFLFTVPLLEQKFERHIAPHCKTACPNIQALACTR